MTWSWPCQVAEKIGFFFSPNTALIGVILKILKRFARGLLAVKSVLSLRVQEKMILQTKFMRTNASKCLGEGKVQFFRKPLHGQFPWDQLLKQELGMPDTFPMRKGHSQERLITQISTHCRERAFPSISSASFRYFLPSSCRPEAVLLHCCAQDGSPGCCWSQRRVVSRPSQGARFGTENTNMEKPFFCASQNHLLLCTERQNFTFHQSGIVAFFSLLLIMESFGYCWMPVYN